MGVFSAFVKTKKLRDKSMKITWNRKRKENGPGNNIGVEVWEEEEAWTEGCGVVWREEGQKSRDQYGCVSSA